MKNRNQKNRNQRLYFAGSRKDTDTAKSYAINRLTQSYHAYEAAYDNFQKALTSPNISENALFAKRLKLNRLFEAEVAAMERVRALGVYAILLNIDTGKVVA